MRRHGPMTFMLIVITHEMSSAISRATYGMQKVMKLRHSCLTVITHARGATSGTTTFMFDSPKTWNVQYIAQNNVWDTKRNGTSHGQVMAHEMSSTRRGAAGVRLQHRQMLRLPPKVTLQHHQMPCLPGQVTLHHEMVRLPRKSQYFFLTEIAWSVAHTEPDDSIMIGDWSELIWSWNCSHNEPVRLHEFFFPLGNAFCMEKLIRSCSSYLPVTAGLHQQLLRLPQEVTFQHHQVLRLPRKYYSITKCCACPEKWQSNLTPNLSRARKSDAGDVVMWFGEMWCDVARSDVRCDVMWWCWHAVARKFLN